MKKKYIYLVQSSDDSTATASYSCLKTLCEDWGLMRHYMSVYRWLRSKDVPYQDSKLSIKKTELIKSERKQTIKTK